jgi:3-dehydroquinate dehydratase-1
MSIFGWIKKNSSQQTAQNTGRASFSAKVANSGEADITELISASAKKAEMEIKNSPVETEETSGFEAVDSDDDDFCLKSVEIDPDRVITNVRGTADGADDSDRTEEDADPREDAAASDGAETESGHVEKRRSLYEWNAGTKKKKKTPKPPRAVKRPVSIGGVCIGGGLPKICVPVCGQTKEDILRQCEEAVSAGPDLIEWRVDHFEGMKDPSSLDEVLRHMTDALRGLPVLFTCRTAAEGGEADPTGEEYGELLLWAAGRTEISAIDVEGMKRDIDPESLIRSVHEKGKVVIGSTHFFSRTPKKAEMEVVFDTLERIDADILKLAVMPEKPKDVMRLMNATVERNEITPRPLITMSMGELGRISRISGSLTGSAMTFGTVGLSSAPGQLSVETLREILRQL